jgi:hypothetical protein
MENSASCQLPIIIASGDGRHLTSEALKHLGRASASRTPYEMETTGRSDVPAAGEVA